MPAGRRRAEGKPDERSFLKLVLWVPMLFRRRRRSEVPEWAAVLGADGYARFRAALNDALGEHELGEGVVIVPGRSTRYGLTNLAQQWSLVDPFERADLVASHFRSRFEAEDAQPPEGESLLRLLRPRLWDSGAASQPGRSLITRAIANDLVAVLCVDRATSVVTLTPEQAAATGRSTSELWQFAIAQIDDGLAVTRNVLDPGVHTVHGDSFFVASRLLDLERFAVPVAPHGLIVAAPTRHMLMFHRVETLATIEALRIMAGISDGFHRDGPGSIVPHLYWWRDGERPLRLVTAVYANAVTVEPPDELLAVLNKLPT